MNEWKIGAKLTLLMNIKKLKLIFYNGVLLALYSIVMLFSGCKTKHLKYINKSAPIGLSIEYIRQPKKVLIIDRKPEFAWVLTNSESTQSAYQIIVASSKEIINKETGDVWNSDKTVTNQSINIEYKGVPLVIGKTYFWKVKAWDESNLESLYSEIQSFRIGEPKEMITTSNSFQVDTIQPKYSKQLSTTSYFIDFGKDAFGNLEFQYNTTENDTLVVHIGEELVDGKINRNPKGTIRYQEIKVPVNPNKQDYVLSIKPDKRNTKPVAIQLSNSFPVLMPFRYAEIENFKQDFSVDDFSQLAYHSYWEEEASYFNSSDTILNKVWDLCKYSIKATTFAGLYVDGDRERIPYEADAYLNQLSHYTTDREYAMARQTIEYFMKHPTWPTEWQLHVALMFHADYMYTGNTELIAKYYDELKHKTLLELRREDGLISSNKATPEFMKKLGFKNLNTKLKDIVDWPPAQKDTGWKLATVEGERDGFVFKPINTVVNCFYYRNLEIMAEFAKVLNKPKEASEFLQLASAVKAAINEKLFDKSQGIYIDGEGTNHSSLHANMMALAFNIVPKNNIKTVANFIKSRGMACSVYGSQYLLEALYNANESDYALELMTATHDRSWYNMIAIGSTITLEAWDMKYKPNADWNHAWGATPANIISRHLWGITPKTPGYGVVSIQPQLEGLRTSVITVPTIKGQIKINYRLAPDNTKRYRIVIPANMRAEFKVNTTSKIKVNNKTKSSKLGILLLKPGISNIEISS